MTTIEALGAAIANINNFHDPYSEAFRCCNPGLLPADSLYYVEEQNKNGVRKFTSLHGGWRALMSDLENKCRGLNNKPGVHVRSKDTLKDLLDTYGLGDEQAIFMITDFVRVATGTKLTAQTKLEELC